MSSKVQPISGMEDTVQTAITATASVSSTMSQKVSLFAKKSGFVIPKNKLSGSMVPIFRGSKKPSGAEVDSKESTKQVLRKTRWDPDLTQDAFVRKGRALAYQTRLDQIMQRLKSGITDTRDDHDSPGAQESSDQQNIEKSELELERREIIEEILKLNPSYKAPPDYKPVLKEDKVAIPIKEYPGRNFVRLIFGPAGDTQKRLEKETGAKIRVYGRKADTREEIEMTSSDSNEAHDAFEELFVFVTAETYDKVDAAVSLIELLITPVLAHTAAVSTNDSVTGDNLNAVSLSQDTTMLVTTGSGLASPLARFQPYLNQWAQTGQSSGLISPPFPNFSVPVLNNPLQVSSTPSNSGPMPSSFGPRTVMSGSLGSVPHNQQPMLQHSHMLQMPNTGYAGQPRNPFPGQPNFSSPLFTPMGSPVPRPMTSTSWSQPPAGSPGPLGPNRPQMMHPTVRPLASQSVGLQTGPPNPGPTSWFPSSTASTSMPPPSVRPPPITAHRPQQPSSNDFTFQANRPQTSSSQHFPRPGNQPGSQFMPPQNPQSPSFWPGTNNHAGQPVMQGFHRPQNSQQHQGPSTMLAPPDRQPVFHGHSPRPLASNMGPRNFGPGPPAGPFSPRPGNFGRGQQNHPSMGFRPQNFLGPPNQQFRGNVPFSVGRPGSNPSRPQQVYDPFSPTAVPHKQGVGNPQSSRKQDTDPEYDDLMASVGVK